MSATMAPAASDRSDFRTVVTGGTKLGAIVVVSVVLYLIVARYLQGMAAGVLEAALVLAAGSAAAFIPAKWCASRSVEGIAGAAALGLFGTVVAAAIDIAVLRPVRAYPWTWDAVGGGMTWWYLPMWWMLGTFLAWMGAVRTAAVARHGEPALVRVAAPVVAAAIIAAAVALVAGLRAPLPVACGAAFVLVLVAFGLVALARKA